MNIALPYSGLANAPARASGQREAQLSDPAGPCIGAWRLTRLLAVGPRTRVYRARPAGESHAGEGDFAIKTTQPQLAADPLARALLRREALVSRMVRHPHLTTVLAEGTTAPAPYLVLPYLTGATAEQLRESCVVDGEDREMLLPIATACLIVRQAAEAVAALHDRGWLHGDVRPANLLIAPTGHTTLLDLGLARRAGGDECRSELLLAATPGYIAPELLSPHGRLTAEGDVYNLGVLLFELAAGRRLFGADDPARLAKLHREQAPPDLRMLRPTASRNLAELVRRMLAKEPLRRPSAAQVVRWLAELEIEELGTS